VSVVENGTLRGAVTFESIRAALRTADGAEEDARPGQGSAGGDGR